MAQISSESRNSFKKIMRGAIAETRAHKKLWIITLVLYGVAFLLFAFNASYCWSGNAVDITIQRFEFQPSAVGAVFAGFGVLVGFFAALNVFRDMNNQQFCDISMALPLRAGERFFSRLLSLFLIQIVPLLVSTVVGNALAVLVGFFRYGEFAQMMHAPSFFQLPLAYLAASMFIMAVTVLCACCCGAMAESAYFSLILMFIINFLPQSFLSHLFENCAGYQTGFVRYTLDGFDFLQNWGFLYLFGTEEEKVIPHCLTGCLISLAVMLLSGLIYRRRDARTVGTPIASRVFFEIVMFLGCATVFSFFAFDNAAIWGVLIAAVIYIIINIIVSRARIGVKSVLVWSGKYLATTAVCVAVFTAASVTGGFGAIALRPGAEYLEGARFQIFDAFGRDGESQTLITDPLSAEQADRVMEICKKHMIAGRRSIGAAFVWKNYPADSTRVHLSAHSETTYPERPFPTWQFREHTVYTRIEGGRRELGGGIVSYSDGGHTYLPDGTYQLDFSQYVRISDAEAESMMEELLALDFVRVQETVYEDTEVPLDPATGLSMETAAQTYDPDYEYAVN